MHGALNWSQDTTCHQRELPEFGSSGVIKSPNPVTVHTAAIILVTHTIGWY